MASNSSSEIAHELTPSFPLFRIYKDGRVERLRGTETVPPSTDLQTGVQSKDIIISTETGLSARIFLTKITNPTKKLPLLVYIHGGAFCVESPFSPLYHNYLTSLAHKADVVAVSVPYRRAPEHPLPTAYDDAWAAIKWVASHVNGDGPEPWLKDHADFGRVFLAGDSAGANISHNVAVRAGAEGVALAGMRIVGMVLMHPFFRNDKPDELIDFIFPSSSGINDPRMNPAVAPEELAKLACTRVLICVAEKDWLKDRGWTYYEALRKSGWGGTVEIVETEGEGHVFHLLDPSSDKAMDLMNKVASFLNHNP